MVLTNQAEVRERKAAEGKAGAAKEVLRGVEAAKAKKGEKAARPTEAERTAREELRAFRAGRKYDRHKAVRVMLYVLAALLGPVISWPISSLLGQEDAVANWVPVEGLVHNSTVRDISKDKRRRFRFRAEWGPGINYSYAYNGETYFSEYVWYYGHSTGTNHTLAQEVVDAYAIDAPCTVYVNPAAPSESLLRKDLWFRPYSMTLLCALLAQVTAYLFYTEYDWNKRAYSTRRFPLVEGEEGKPGAKWYAIDCGLRLQPVSFYTPQLLGMVAYHAVGAYALFRFLAANHLQYGWREVAFGYHGIGVLIVLRLLYLTYLSRWMGDMELWISQAKITVDNNIQARLKQDVHGAQRFKTLKLDLVCRKTFQKTRNNKTKRDDEFLHKETIDLNKPRGGGSGEGGLVLENGKPLDLEFMLSFPKHVSEDREPKPNERVFTQWFIMIEARLAGMWTSYSVHQRVHVYDHPRS